MKIVGEPLVGVKVIAPLCSADKRGRFVKTYHRAIFAELGIKFDFAEEFYSVSRAGVIRGMHFQLPPHAHDKVIYCVKGGVLDVLLDLRTDSPTYGQSVAVDLSGENCSIVFIPIGIAHGFLCKSDEAILVYKTSAVYVPSHDTGIRWDSFGFNWAVEAPVISERDAKLSTLASFSSPFKFMPTVYSK